MPLFVHKRQSPSGGLLFGGVDQGALSTFFTSSTAHCSLDSRVRENVSVEIGPEFLSWSPIFTASRLPKSMNLLSSCIIFNLLCFCRPLRSGHEAGYLRPSDDSQISWRAHTRVSHAPCGEAWAPNTCASGSALSRMTKGLFGSFQLCWPPHAAARRTPVAKGEEGRHLMLPMLFVSLHMETQERNTVTKGREGKPPPKERRSVGVVLHVFLLWKKPKQENTPHQGRGGRKVAASPREREREKVSHVFLQKFGKDNKSEDQHPRREGRALSKGKERPCPSNSVYCSFAEIKRMKPPPPTGKVASRLPQERRSLVLITSILSLLCAQEKRTPLSKGERTDSKSRKRRCLVFTI